MASETGKVPEPPRKQDSRRPVFRWVIEADDLIISIVLMVFTLLETETDYRVLLGYFVNRPPQAARILTVFLSSVIVLSLGSLLFGILKRRRRRQRQELIGALVAWEGNFFRTVKSDLKPLLQGGIQQGGK